MKLNLSAAELSIAANQLPHSKAYWTAQLAELPAPAMICPDYRQGERLQEGRDTVVASFPAMLSEKLQALGGNSDEGLHVVLTAVVMLLLHKYTAVNDIIITTPIDRQEDTSTCVNYSLPLRMRVNGELTITQLLEEISAIVSDAVQHQDFPVLWVDGKELSGSTLPSVLSATGLVLAPLQDITYLGEQLPEMLFVFSKEANGILLTLSFNTALYSRETATQVAAAGTQMAGFFAADLEQPLSACHLSGPGIQVSRLANNQHHFPLDKHLVHFFTEQAQLHKDAVALVCGAQHLTYGALCDAARQLAAAIRQASAAQQVVGVLTDRSVDTVVGIMGILMAGYAYLPIEADTPAQRIEFMLDNSDVAIVVSSRRVWNHLSAPVYTQNRHLIFSDTAITAAPDERISLPDFSSSTPAYVIYTSGSTGTPKGVLMEHRPPVNLVYGLKETVFDKQEGPLSMGLISPFIFDASIQLLMGSLMFGHKLHILSLAERADGKLLMAALERYAVQVADGTPTHLSLMLQDKGSNRAGLALRDIIIGGDVLHGKVLKEFMALTGGKVTVTNVYGPTEAAINATYFTIRPADTDHLKQIPIGKPFPNYEIFVVNELGELCMRGEPGELWIAGEGLALGYKGNDTATAEKFVTCGDWAPGVRAYKTGDIVRLSMDGLLYFLHRKDKQVKINGYRIELEEISKHIKDLEGVTAAVAVAHTENNGEMYIIAYYTAVAVTANDIKTDLATRLPHYMHPAYYIPLDTFPLLPNGKYDYKRLPDPRLLLDSREVADIPANDTEVRLRDIWKDVLKLEKLGVNENFFSVGGNSIRSISLLHTVNKIFGTTLNIVAIYEHNTVRKMALAITGKETEAPSETQYEEVSAEISALRNQILNSI